jgi:hypothetical protein
MKNIVILLIMFLFPLSFANSQVKGFGAGIIIGEPTGISVKGWLSPKTAIDAAIAWSFVSQSSMHIHADYLWHTSSLISSSSGELPFYYGIGGRLKFENNSDHSSSGTRLGVRVPVGLSYEFNNAPVDIFLEVVPVLDLTPETSLTINSGLGARFYFK